MPGLRRLLGQRRHHSLRVRRLACSLASFAHLLFHSFKDQEDTSETKQTESDADVDVSPTTSTKNPNDARHMSMLPHFQYALRFVVLFLFCLLCSSMYENKRQKAKPTAALKIADFFLCCSARGRADDIDDDDDEE